MSNFNNYYEHIRDLHPNIDIDIRRILYDQFCRLPENGITMSELRTAYKAETEHDFPVKGTVETQLNFLLTVPYVSVFCNARGTAFIYVVEPCKLEYN